MQRIQQILWGGLVGLSLLWWAVDTTGWSRLDGVFAWRGVLTQWSGLLAMAVMSAALVLSVRPRWLEPWLGGLDKVYRLHKWLGISALTLAVSHWLIVKGPKWLVAWGWLEKRARKPRPQFPEESWQHWFMSQRGLAEDVGEWAFYLAAALMVLALLKWFPYRRFFQTHRILALAYLALVYHALILFKFDYWPTLLGAVLVVLLGMGSVSAILAFFRRRLGAASHAGHLTRIDALPGSQALRLEVQTPTWTGHQPGQFAFVDGLDGEGPHPFTIASAWQGDGRLNFIIKGLGDYTRNLPGTLRVGSSLKIEGPYGGFTLQREWTPQIWVAGGVGITPFLAQLEALATLPQPLTIHLFYATADTNDVLTCRVRELAAQARVNLHVFRSALGERLTFEAIQQAVPDLDLACLCFCGPDSLGTLLRQQWLALGRPQHTFHQELFAMR